MALEIDFSELARSVPELSEMESRARAVQDDGSGRYFCSNYHWLPMYTHLRDVIGAQRKRVGEEAREGLLFDSDAFQVAYEHLSTLLPPCRDCGCVVFAELVVDRGQEGRRGERSPAGD